MVIILFLVLGVMIGPPIILVVIGLSQRKKNLQVAKLCYILAAVYVIVGGGICFSMLN